MANLRVEDLMTDMVYSVHQDEDLERLTELMNDIHIRHVPVVDDEGIVQGLVSHRDLLGSVLYAQREIPANDFREVLKGMKVAEIMVKGVETVDPQQAIEEAGAIMFDNKLGCLPVVENEKLIGILTEADFVKYVVDHAGEL